MHKKDKPAAVLPAYRLPPSQYSQLPPTVLTHNDSVVVLPGGGSCRLPPAKGKATFRDSQATQDEKKKVQISKEGA
nr:hypothetical protein [Dickeya zeae]